MPDPVTVFRVVRFVALPKLISPPSSCRCAFQVLPLPVRPFPTALNSTVLILLQFVFRSRGIRASRDASTSEHVVNSSTCSRKSESKSSRRLRGGDHARPCACASTCTCTRACACLPDRAPALTAHSRGQSSMLGAPCCFMYRITPRLPRKSHLSGGCAGEAERARTRR